MPRHPTVSENGGLFADSAGQSLEAWARAHGYRLPAGADEAGRGPLAGPVVAAVVVLGAARIAGLADSKQLRPDRREVLARQVVERSAAVGLGVVNHARIDATDIRRASLEAMSLALQEVLDQGVVPDLVLVDGRDVFQLPAGAPAMQVRAFIKGDQRSRAIGAASIVAKVYRDTLMTEYHSLWPEYGFNRHKGYPTAAHKRALAEHGPCEIHRRSFRGVVPDPD